MAMQRIPKNLRLIDPERLSPALNLASIFVRDPEAEHCHTTKDNPYDSIALASSDSVRRT
jgi:hypothetical protein